jgi:hypothetical protein
LSQNSQKQQTHFCLFCSTVFSPAIDTDQVIRSPDRFLPVLLNDISRARVIMDRINERNIRIVSCLFCSTVFSPAIDTDQVIRSPDRFLPILLNDLRRPGDYETLDKNLCVVLLVPLKDILQELITFYTKRTNFPFQATIPCIIIC